MSKRKREEFEDPFSILSVTRTADTEEIKKAYRRLALKYHPDRNQGKDEASAQFQKIHHAYKWLLEEHVRRKEQESTNFFKSEDLQRAFDHLINNGNGTAESLQELFRNFSRNTASTNGNSNGNVNGNANANGGKSSEEQALQPRGSGSNFTVPPFIKPPKPGQTLRTTVHVSFQESVRGCVKTLKLTRQGRCDQCDGLGYPPDAEPVSCPECNGTGFFSRQSALLSIRSYCPHCQGKGQVVTAKCGKCVDGKVPTVHEMKIEVPAGITKGMKKVFKGEGDVGDIGAENGDLVVVFDVEQSSRFKQEGDCAITEVFVSFYQAALGDTIRIEGLYHPFDLTIPASTQSNQILCVPDQGFTNIHTKKRGPLFVCVIVDVPKSLTPKQRELLYDFKRRWEALS